MPMALAKNSLFGESSICWREKTHKHGDWGLGSPSSTSSSHLLLGISPNQGVIIKEQNEHIK